MIIQIPTDDWTAVSRLHTYIFIVNVKLFDICRHNCIQLDWCWKIFNIKLSLNYLGEYCFVDWTMAEIYIYCYLDYNFSNWSKINVAYRVLSASNSTWYFIFFFWRYIIIYKHLCMYLFIIFYCNYCLVVYNNIVVILLQWQDQQVWYSNCCGQFDIV